MTTINTYTAEIYCGLKEGYDGEQHTLREAIDACGEYVDAVGLCVTVEEVVYKYVSGEETGVRVGLINYPRFPTSPKNIRTRAKHLALKLKDRFKQNRVTVVFPDYTTMLGSD